MTLKYLMWVLETVLLSSRRANRAFNCVIIYLVIYFLLKYEEYYTYKSEEKSQLTKFLLCNIANLTEFNQQHARIKVGDPGSRHL